MTKAVKDNVWSGERSFYSLHLSFCIQLFLALLCFWFSLFDITFHSVLDHWVQLSLPSQATGFTLQPVRAKLCGRGWSFRYVCFPRFPHSHPSPSPPAIHLELHWLREYPPVYHETKRISWFPGYLQWSTLFCFCFLIWIADWLKNKSRYHSPPDETIYFEEVSSLFKTLAQF